MVSSLVKAWKCPLATEVKRFGDETALPQPPQYASEPPCGSEPPEMLERPGEEVVCWGRLFFRRITSRHIFRKRDAEGQIAATVEQIG